MIRPSSFAVFALNALQKSMMLTPAWPSAGPTGGAGVAFPAGIWSLICPTTFFIARSQRKPRSHGGHRATPCDACVRFPIRLYQLPCLRSLCLAVTSRLELLDLQEVQLDRG